MFIYNLDESVSSDVVDPERLLTKNQYTLFLKVLFENKIAKDQFVSAISSSIIFIDEINIFVCHVRDLAGLRFILLGHRDMDYRLLTNPIWKKLEMAAKIAGADLVQVLLPFSEVGRIGSFNNIL